MIWRERGLRLFLRPINEKWPVRLSARTAPFHGAKTGSIPVPATLDYQKPLITLVFKGFLFLKVTVWVTVFQIAQLIAANINYYIFS